MPCHAAFRETRQCDLRVAAGSGVIHRDKAASPATAMDAARHLHRGARRTFNQ